MTAERTAQPQGPPPPGPPHAPPPGLPHAQPPGPPHAQPSGPRQSFGPQQLTGEPQQLTGEPQQPSGDPQQPSGDPQQWSPQPAAPRTAARGRRLLGPVAALAATAAAVAYVGSVDPNEPGHYPACPLLRTTGLFCPGCGGLRCVHALVHGDLPAALGANAMAVVGFVIAAFVWILWLRRAWRGGPTGFTVRSSYAWAFGGLLAVFTVVRNLPFGDFLHP